MNKIRVILSITTIMLLINSCFRKEKSDMMENISVDLSNNKPIKLYRHANFLELAGVNCDFFKNYEKNKESYSVLMEKLYKKNWKFDFISLEYESYCFNDSLFVEFKKLNKDIFGANLKSITFEESIVVIELYTPNGSYNE